MGRLSEKLKAAAKWLTWPFGEADEERNMSRLLAGVHVWISHRDAQALTGVARVHNVYRSEGGWRLAFGEEGQLSAFLTDEQMTKLVERHEILADDLSWRIALYP